MQCKGGVYVITNTVNEKRYIGSSYDVRRRWINHQCGLRNNNHPNRHLQAAYNRYGAGSFSFAVLEYIEDETLLLVREQYYLDTCSPEYNITPTAGSLIGMKASPEARAKLSAALKGRKQTPEARANMSAAQRQRTYWPSLSIEARARISQSLKGRERTPEHQAKLREASKKRGISPEVIAKAHAANRGRKFSPEHLEKLSRVHRGRKHTPEHIAKRAQASKLTWANKRLAAGEKEKSLPKAKKVSVKHSRIEVNVSVDEERYFKPSEFAMIFKVSTVTTLRLIKRGELQATQTGKQYKIPQSEIDRFLCKC